MHARWLAAVAVLAVVVPGTVGASKAPAVLGSTTMEYTLQLPPNWVAKNACSTHVTAISSQTPPVSLSVTIENHGWWSDGRSRASITGDMSHDHKLQSKISWISHSDVYDHWWVMAIAVVLIPRTATYLIDWEAETFANGRLFRLISTVESGPDNSVQTKRLDEMNGLIKSFELVGDAALPPERRWARDKTSDTYVQVNDHPDIYFGNKIVWNCVIAKFLGNDPDIARNIDIGCEEFISQFGTDTTEGEILIAVPPEIDTRAMNTGDRVTVYGTVAHPWIGTNVYGAQATWTRVTAVYLINHGVYHAPNS